MREIYRTINPAEIALLKSIFLSAHIHFFVFDEQMSSLGIGAYSACCFMVLEDEYDDASKVLKEYELEPAA